MGSSHLGQRCWLVWRRAPTRSSRCSHAAAFSPVCEDSPPPATAVRPGEDAAVMDSSSQRQRWPQPCSPAAPGSRARTQPGTPCTRSRPAPACLIDPAQHWAPNTFPREQKWFSILYPISPPDCTGNTTGGKHFLPSKDPFQIARACNHAVADPPQRPPDPC